MGTEDEGEGKDSLDRWTRLPERLALKELSMGDFGFQNVESTCFSLTGS